MSHRHFYCSNFLTLVWMLNTIKLSYNDFGLCDILASVIHSVKVKVKGTLAQAQRLCTGRTAHMGSRGITLLFLDHGNRSRWGVCITPRLLFTPRKDPVPIVQEAGWALGTVWIGAENLTPTRIGSPDCPACSQSLCRLCYPAHRHQLIRHTAHFSSLPSTTCKSIYLWYNDIASHLFQHNFPSWPFWEF